MHICEEKVGPAAQRRENVINAFVRRIYLNRGFCYWRNLTFAKTREVDDLDFVIAHGRERGRNEDRIECIRSPIFAVSCGVSIHRCRWGSWLAVKNDQPTGLVPDSGGTCMQQAGEEESGPTGFAVNRLR